VNDGVLEGIAYGAEFERQQFELYEARRLAAETHANAVVAAALAIAAFVLSDYDRRSQPGVPWLIAALVGVAWTLAFANLARVVSWKTPRWRGGPDSSSPSEKPSDVVARTLTATRDADIADPIGWHRAALMHWQARAKSAWHLGDMKRRRLDIALWGLLGPLAYFAARLAT